MQENQLCKFQKQISSAFAGYLSLLKRKELLYTSMELNNDLRQLDPNIQKSIKAIQDSLYSSLLIEVHSWLFDASNNSSNLSINKIMLLLDKPENEFNTKYIKNYYVNTPVRINLGELKLNRKDSFTCMREAEFDQVLDECKRHICALLSSEQATRIKQLRDKVLAHKDGIYDVKRNAHTIDDLFYLIEKMKNILFSLKKLFLRVSYPLKGRKEEEAKQHAKIFWNHVACTS